MTYPTTPGSGPSSSFPSASASYSVRYAFNDQYAKQQYSSAGHHPQQLPVKVEESPDLPPVHAHHAHRPHPLRTPSSQDAPIFRFGSGSGPSSASPTSTSPVPFTYMSQHQQWPGPAAGSSSSYHQQTHHGHQQHQHQQAYAVDRSGYGLASSMNGHHAMSMQDDYDAEEDDGLGDLPGPGLSGLGLPPYNAASSSGIGGNSKNEKQIRRRSSKACDQCRKSKCKCERGSPQDPCRNCVMLGTRESSLSIFARIYRLSSWCI